MEFLNVLFPVYNEHIRLRKGIKRTVAYLDRLIPGDYRLTIVDNASTDDTADIARELCAEYSQVHYIGLDRKGVGVAFRAGVAENECPIVGYMDVDLSTDLQHLEQVIDLFRADAKLDMVNGSRWSAESRTEGRKWYRNITSHGLTTVLKIRLGMKASDSICGFKFYRKATVEALVREAGSESDGWFYIIELLLRAERNGMKIDELPVHWVDDYNSTVHVGSQTKNYLEEIEKLRRKFRAEREGTSCSQQDAYPERPS